MPDVQRPPTPNPSQKKGDDAPSASEAGRAAAAESRAFDEGARRAKEGVRAAEAVAERTADASRAAAQANVEILQSQTETVQQAVRSSLEVGARGLEGLTRSWTRAFGVTAPNPDLAEQSAQNVQAVAQASRALAKGAQDASQAWFELTQRTVRTNLEAMNRFVGCRTVQEVFAVHSRLLRDNLQQAIESGEAISRASADAIREATQAMQAPQGAERPRA